jgi:hypothetical protein
VSKLEHGFVSEKDLAAQKDLVVKLLDWFNFETCPEAEKVLNLILRLIKVRRMACQPIDWTFVEDSFGVFRMLLTLKVQDSNVVSLL